MRPLALILPIGVALVVLGACEPPAPVVRSADDEERSATAPPPTTMAPPKATGAMTSASLVVRGNAATRYRAAFERALLRAGCKVVDAAAQAFDLELVLQVDTDYDEEVPEDVDDGNPNQIGLEVAKYKAIVTVRRRGSETAVERFEISPKFGLREVTAEGRPLKTMMSKEQADVEFCGPGLDQLIGKLVTSQTVEQAAAGARASVGGDGGLADAPVTP